MDAQTHMKDDVKRNTQLARKRYAMTEAETRAKKCEQH